MKKLFLIFIIPLSVFGQGWDFLGYYNADGRHHPITFSNSRYGYVIAGQNGEGQYLKDMFRYDSYENIWVQLEDFPGEERGYAYGVSNDLYGYIGFGSNSNSYLNDWWRYDMTNDAWEELAPFPFIGRNHPAMILVDNKIFVGMGSVDGENLDDWWEYNILSNTWTQKSDFPFGKRHHPFYFGIDNVPYVGFGHGNDENFNMLIYNDFYKYDIISDGWVELNAFPSEGRVAGTQFSVNGKGYIMSGDGDDHGPLDSGELWEYQPEEDSWIQLLSHPGGARWAPGCFVIDCSIYLTSGFEAESGTYYNDLLKYKLSEDCGCTDQNALNYNDLASINDNSCCYIAGCTDPNAINYNSLACVDDSSCLPIILGCTNINATNYNNLANMSSAFTGPNYLELGPGGFHYNDMWDMVFNCYEDVTIKSVDLYSEEIFSVQIEILDNNNNQIYLASFPLEIGLNQINLDLTITEGTNYKIGINGNNEGLYRNSSVSSDIFPIDLLNIIEITSNTTDSPFDYYYYFYNWQLEIACNDIVGCTDMLACNYNPDATSDDGSCYFIGDSCIAMIEEGGELIYGTYDESCACIENGSYIKEFQNSTEPIKVIDQLGRKVSLSLTNILLIEIYNDGSVKKTYTVSGK